MARGHITATHRQASYLDPGKCSICARIYRERLEQEQRASRGKAASAAAVVDRMRSAGRTPAELAEAQKWVDKISDPAEAAFADRYREHLDELVSDPDAYARRWMAVLGPHSGLRRKIDQGLPLTRDEEMSLKFKKHAIAPYEQILSEREERGL